MVLLGVDVKREKLMKDINIRQEEEKKELLNLFACIFGASAFFILLSFFIAGFIGG